MTTPLAIRSLKKRSEYLEVAASGIKEVRPGLVLQYRQNPDKGGEIAIGLTVSGRTGNAVKRSRIKRRLRVLIREVLAGEGKPGAAYVVVGRAAALTRDFEDLRKDLQMALAALHSREQKGKRS